jgi:hypothetical protein
MKTVNLNHIKAKFAIVNCFFFSLYIFNVFSKSKYFKIEKYCFYKKFFIFLVLFKRNFIYFGIALNRFKKQGGKKLRFTTDLDESISGLNN